LNLNSKRDKVKESDSERFLKEDLSHNKNGMAKKDYSRLEKDDLLKVIEKLESRKKYGLVWDEEKTKEKFEKESENALPVLKEVKSKEIKTDASKPTNILIEGDNYHALSVLNYTHQNKIDVIYIDPPYNTGNKSWKYNNQYVEKDDAFKHSKWLSFMSKRLRLAKNLLKDEGVLIVTIDDYELHTLGLLMSEIFGEDNRMSTLIIESNPRGRTSDAFFATSHEYYLYYAKNSSLVSFFNPALTEEQEVVFKLEDEISRYRLLPLRKSGAASRRKDRPKQFYPIYVRKSDLALSMSKFKEKCVKLLPIDETGEERVWKIGIKTCHNLIESGDIVVSKNGKGSYTLSQKDRIKAGRKPKTLWIDPKYDASAHGTILISSILGKANAFNYPKSLYAVIDSLNVLLKEKKNATVLDFFAGSGTTGHAVMQINNSDGGTRKFILCTNNENGICENICYPRIKNVTRGYKTEKGKVEKGLGGNLKYFRTAFVKNSISRDDLKIRITRECTEMLCLREGIFDEVKVKPDYHIFEQNGRIMGVYYSMERDSLAQLKKELNKMEGEKILYCFTFDPLGLDKNDFADWQGVSLEPIPQKILDIYEQIYEY
jgi:adenine-specific DNA-methyltransferase